MQDAAKTTLIACLTPPGAGAIATLALQGPDAWPITRALFRARLPERPVAGKFYLGKLGDDANACDEVVLAVTEDGLELHCHGGVEVVRFIQGLYAARGAKICAWKELAWQVGGLPRGSRLHLLALEQLMLAPTVKTAGILLDQVHGAFENTLAEIAGALRAGDHAPALSRLSRLFGTQHLGRHLVEPFRVVIAGAPNVGKSSLVNAIAGFTRSVVSPIAGTTRDVVSTRIALDGWPVELLDTAGFHETDSALEKEGIARARKVMDEAALRLWVVDGSIAPALPPPDLPCDAMVINKVDLPVWGMVLSAFRPARAVSCKTGQGMAALCQWIVSLLRLEEDLAPGEGVPFTPELCDKIVQAYEAARAEDWATVLSTLY